ncbi:NAD-dependent deacetylase [Chloroflexota bacterium]
MNSKYTIALTGAGMSTESGIADYRGPDGVWTKDPEAEKRAYTSYKRFTEDPKGWWEERLIRMSTHKSNYEDAAPNSGHYALVELENMGILKCVSTQNIDALHEKAGIKNLFEYHGSIAKLRCISCNLRFNREGFELEKFTKNGQLPPRCPECNGIIKSDVVEFGEPIPSDVAEKSMVEAQKCDLMLICGTSAVVYPFASLPIVAKQRGVATIVEINAELTPLTTEHISNYILQGKTGEILPKIVEEVKRLKE